MKRSTDRILTTHVGSLARPEELLDLMRSRALGEPYDDQAYERGRPPRGRDMRARPGRERPGQRVRRRAGKDRPRDLHR